jgi:uncharacterized membrane protein YqhA
MDKPARSLQRTIERGMLATRFLMAIPVALSLFLALAALYLAAVDTIYVLTHLADYALSGSPSQDAIRVKLLATIIKSFDTYLIAAVLLVFAFGLYELFISPLEVAEQMGIAGRLLIVRSLDDLKDRLARLVLLVLVVEVLQQALLSNYSSPLDVFYLAIATLLVGAAIFLGNLGGARGSLIRGAPRAAPPTSDMSAVPGEDE